METPPPLEDHSFTPPNHKLITLYLRRRVAREPLPSAAAAYFHDTDIYAAEPAALTAGLRPAPARNGEAKCWLFFTPVKTKSSTDSRRSRRVSGGVGTWHSEHAPEAVVDDEGRRVGHRQLFSYKEKGGRRSGWSMWEFGAADQEEGGEALLVLCKIHQTHAGSRRVDGAAARSSAARKRKGTEDGDMDKVGPALVKRRLFVPPAPTTLVTSEEDKIGVTSEAIRRTETEQFLDKLDAMLEAIPSCRVETEPSIDTPKDVLSFWEEPYLLQLDKVIETSLTSGRSFLTEPNVSQENIFNNSMECPTTTSFLIPDPEVPIPATASFLIPEPEVPIPSSRGETESSKDTPRHVLSFWEEPSVLQQDTTNATTLSSVHSCLPTPDASQENIVSTTMESPASFMIPEPQASQGEMDAFDCGFQMDHGVPPALEYRFTDDSGSNVSGMPPCASDAESFRPWTGYNTMLTLCSVGNAFQGGFPTCGEFHAGASGSLTGYDTVASCSGDIGALPAYGEWFVPGSTGVQYGCMPTATFLPSAMPSQLCGAPGFLSC